MRQAASHMERNDRKKLRSITLRSAICRLLVACFLSLAAIPVFAADLSFEVKNSDIRTGDAFEAGFFLNTGGEDINAVEGKIVFPEKLLELKEIKDGNSIINLWIERPKAKNGEILFSGIIPGGYMDRRGLVFSMVFQALQEGPGAIEIRDMRTLLNDGKGTAANTTISDSRFVISATAPAAQPAAVEKKDIDMPEAFEPAVASDPTMFDGKYFLVFAAQDKGSGIDRYEVREGERPFVAAESPHLLQNQHLDEEIAVKAVDKSGNERVVVLPPTKASPRYQNYWIFAILVIAAVIIVGVVLGKILWQRFLKSR